LKKLGTTEETPGPEKLELVIDTPRFGQENGWVLGREDRAGREKAMKKWLPKGSSQPAFLPAFSAVTQLLRVLCKRCVP
jgi:hypothetical protein